jgi:hypothetical protein
VDPADLGDNGRLAENADDDFDDVNSCFGGYQPITEGPTSPAAQLACSITAPTVDPITPSGPATAGSNGEQCRNDNDNNCPDVGLLPAGGLSPNLALELMNLTTRMAYEQVRCGKQHRSGRGLEHRAVPRDGELAPPLLCSVIAGVET